MTSQAMHSHVLAGAETNNRTAAYGALAVSRSHTGTPLGFSCKLQK